VGSPNQLDFGVDSDCREVLTLTNPAATIMCHTKENQLLATHRITVRYTDEHNFVHRHREFVKLVHGDVADLIRRAKDEWVASKPPAAHIGDKIVVTVTLKEYREFKDMKGVVCHIVKGQTFLLCVRLDTVRLRASVRRLNANKANHTRNSFLQQDEGDLLLLTTDQVRITHKVIPPRVSIPRKCKRDALP
jgi:hypothetical protein